VPAVARWRALPRGDGHFITRDSLSLWYTISGKGPPLVVPTPGWGASSDLYMRSLIPLEGSFSVIYFDTRGAGRSDAPLEDSGYFFKYFLDDLEALHLHLQFHEWFVFAHSDASLQATMYAIKYRKACRGIFIVDGTVNNDDKEYERDRAKRMRRLSRQPWYAAANTALNRIRNQAKNSRRALLALGYRCILLATALP